jgi:hypothetical protein
LKKNKLIKMEKEINSFEDLVFGIHPSAGRGAVQASHELPNGIVISVVGGFPSENHMSLNGDGVHHFEVAAWHKEGHDWIDLSEDGRLILFWQNRNQINEVIQKLLKI